MIKIKSILFSVIVASLAGFLFGFDTIVISGADRPIQLLWETSDLFHGTFIMSMALWGTVIGALFGGIPCNRIGRRKTLFWIALLLLVLIFLSCSSGQRSSSEGQRPNVLFISIDDLRNELGALGVDHIYTPHLDTFADESRLFSRHYVQVPTCGALTGPASHGSLISL